MAGALFLRESPLDHQQHAMDHLHSSHVQQEHFFSPSSCVEYEPLGMSTFPPPLTVSDPYSFLRHPTSCIPLEIDAACHQQQDTEQQQQQQQHKLLQRIGPGFTPYDRPFQFEFPEIESCSTWRGYVLDELLNSTPELPPLGSELPTLGPADGSFDAIPPVADCSSRWPAVNPSSEDELAPSRQPTTPSPTVKRSPGVSSPRRVNTPEYFSPLSPTSKPLKPGGSRRCRRVAKNLKRVSNAEHLDHVRRERERRDDMSLKVSKLECLLPPAVDNFKRDRVTIVDDSVDYVKSLQEKVEELKKKWTELKLRKRTRAALRCEAVKGRNPELAASSSKSQLVECHVQVEGEDEGGARLEKCRFRPDFMSSAMKVLELLNLDVCRCTITKMFDYVICVIVAKPRLTSNQVSTSASVVSAFRSSLQLS